MPRNGSEGSFRDAVRNLRTDQLDDCFLTVFHVSDSFALFSGEAIAGANTATNDALHAYLVGSLVENGTGLDFDVKIEHGSEAARTRS